MLKSKGLGQDTLIRSSWGGANSISSHAARRDHFQFHFLIIAIFQATWLRLDV